MLRVDGSRVELTPGVPYSHTAHDVELFTVKMEHEYFEVTSKPYGLYLGFNGNMLVVQVRKLVELVFVTMGHPWSMVHRLRMDSF